VRDRAVLLLGFAMAGRRGEIVDLEVSGLPFEPAGLRLTLGKTKTDQEAKGQEIGITKPVVIATVQALLQRAGIVSGPVFRSIDRHQNIGAGLSRQSIALIVKRRADAAGLDAALFSGHSLRRGFCTSAARNALSTSAIMAVSRHRSEKMVLRCID
jgi:integrase